MDAAEPRHGHEDRRAGGLDHGIEARLTSQLGQPGRQLGVHGRFRITRVTVPQDAIGHLASVTMSLPHAESAHSVHSSRIGERNAHSRWALLAYGIVQTSDTGVIAYVGLAASVYGLKSCVA